MWRTTGVPLCEPRNSPSHPGWPGRLRNTTGWAAVPSDTKLAVLPLEVPAESPKSPTLSAADVSNAITRPVSSDTLTPDDDQMLRNPVTRYGAGCR